ncbi:hypothetical protein D3C73_1471780 [compost metagenome]
MDYYAPPFRFEQEGNNPWIPWREMSETPLPKENLDARLVKEHQDAVNQINYVRDTIKSLKADALKVSG